MFAKAQDVYAKAGAGLTAAIMVLAPNSAHAENMVDVFGGIKTNMQAFPTLISYGAYIGGCGLGMAGILKLREHVDAPQQVKMKDGLARCAAAGALVALPYMINAFMGTMTNDSGGGVTTTVPQLGQ
jgi:hypothetical protein